MKRNDSVAALEHLSAFNTCRARGALRRLSGALYGGATTDSVAIIVSVTMKPTAAGSMAFSRLLK